VAGAAGVAHVLDNILRPELLDAMALAGLLHLSFPNPICPPKPAHQFLGPLIYRLFLTIDSLYR
jgi:hypothetical protein